MRRSTALNLLAGTFLVPASIGAAVALGLDSSLDSTTSVQLQAIDPPPIVFEPPVGETPLSYIMWHELGSYVNNERAVREAMRRDNRINITLRRLVVFQTPEYTVALHGKKVVVTTTDPRLVRVREAR